MKFIIKLFPEITIKSPPVRKQLIRQLRKNIRKICQRYDPNVDIHSEWDLIHLKTESSDTVTLHYLKEVLSHTPGISHCFEVAEFPLVDLDEILAQCEILHSARLKGKTFAVRVKRSGKHTFSSIEAERYIGGGLNQRTEAAGVKLKQPDITINIEIKHDRYFLIKERYEGLGGFPLGTQEPVLSLISGGFDSAVTSFLTMKRGINTHFCFFNLGGSAHEVGVKEVALYLWGKYGSSHYVRFVTIPFQGVVEQILTNVDPSQMGVILKRMMMRAATTVAKEMDIRALSTGEAIAQVSSQTLPNLSVIDAVTDMLTLRPLIVMDKQEIISLARKIGTEEFSKNIPEYCAVISKKPTTRANPEKIAREESKIDFTVLDDAIKNRKNERITDLVSQTEVDSLNEVALVDTPQADDIIIDIRHPSESETSPLYVEDAEVLDIPFYKLETQMQTLNSSQRYLLFCEQGVMSRLHAAHLAGEGHKNVGVYLVPTTSQKPRNKDQQ